MGPRHASIMGVWGLHTGVSACIRKLPECSSYCRHLHNLCLSSLATLARNPFFILSPHHTYHHHRRSFSIYQPSVLYNNSFLLFIRLSLSVCQFFRSSHTHIPVASTNCLLRTPRYHFQYLPSSTVWALFSPQSHCGFKCLPLAGFCFVVALNEPSSHRLPILFPI